MPEEFQEPSDIWQAAAADAYTTLGSGEAGLTYTEVEASRTAYGTNELDTVRKSPIIWKFLGNFYHLMALLLWAAAILAFVADEPELAWTIIAVIAINAVFSFSQ